PRRNAWRSSSISRRHDAGRRRPGRPAGRDGTGPRRDTITRRIRSAPDPRGPPPVGKLISVIIPAYNEERYLPQTLEHLHRAMDCLGEGHDEKVEVIVVDNASTDRTAEVAIAAGARVVPVPEHNIGRVRNAGALAASGDLLIFLDADTLIPDTLLSRVALAMG